jgi:hypothetical protein
MNFEQAERKRDLERETSYYADDNICLRCEEEVAEDGNDYCYICEEIIKEQNRDKFQSEETY